MSTTSNLPSANRIVFDLTFVEDAFNELPYYMQQKDNLVKLLLVIAKRFETVQTEAIKLALSRLVDNAEGVMLDNIANMLFINRTSNNDSSLQGAIKLRALRQDAEGTRDEIMKILRIVSNDEYLKVFKAEKNYIEIVFPSECLTVSDIKISLSDLFPINTNLAIGDAVSGINVFGVGSVHTEASSEIGVLGSIHDLPSTRTQTTSVLLVSSERDSV